MVFQTRFTIQRMKTYRFKTCFFCVPSHCEDPNVNLQHWAGGRTHFPIPSSRINSRIWCANNKNQSIFSVPSQGTCCSLVNFMIFGRLTLSPLIGFPGHSIKPVLNKWPLSGKVSTFSHLEPTVVSMTCSNEALDNYILEADMDHCDDARRSVALTYLQVVWFDASRKHLSQKCQKINENRIDEMPSMVIGS